MVLQVCDSSRLRQEDPELKPGLDSTVRPCLFKKKKGGGWGKAFETALLGKSDKLSKLCKVGTLTPTSTGLT